MKTCGSCKSSKPIESFPFKCRAEGRRHTYCSECGKQMQRSHYQRNKRDYANRNKDMVEAARDIIRDAKSVPCVDCGQCFHYCVMDFDHRPGEIKLFSVADAPKRGVSFDKVRAEIAKCDPVCANCHRLRTFKRMYPSVLPP